MKDELIRIIENMKKYNSGNMANECFGFDATTDYDAVVIAPGWKPTKIIKDNSFKITTLKEHSYFSGYEVEKNGTKIAWAQTASGACNVLDHTLVLADIKFKKMIFVGAAGSLSEKHDVGDFITPEYCVSGVFANHYLCPKLDDFKPFNRIYPEKNYIESIKKLASKNGYTLKTAPVFCTDSIALEYSHLQEIKETGAEIIEMETGSFYTIAALFEKKAVAMLVVSDNSATGAELLGRPPALDKKYKDTRISIIPDMIFKIATEK